MRFPNGAGYFPETEDVWPTDDTYDNNKKKSRFTKADYKKNKRQKKGAYESSGEDY